MTNPDFYRCGKCKGEMKRGFIVDANHRDSFYEYYHYSFWVEGEPVHETGIFGGKSSSLDISRQRKFVIRASRCTNCGYLELYAV